MTVTCVDAPLSWAMWFRRIVVWSDWDEVNTKWKIAAEVPELIG